jgi:hypothetical protein
VLVSGEAVNGKPQRNRFFPAFRFLNQFGFAFRLKPFTNHLWGRVVCERNNLGSI